MLARVVLVTIALVACACAGSRAPASSPQLPGFQFEVGGSFIFPSAVPGAATGFGGLSGLAALGDGRQMLAICDERENSRVFRVALDWSPAGVSVIPLGAIPLQLGGGAPETLDPEGIVLTRDGHFIVSSEGVGNRQPRLPPALVEYDMDGKLVRQLPVRPRYLPNATGPVITGVRENAGFESLTITSDFSRVFTATELPLAQDGDADPFRSRMRTRILEYVAEGNTYQPGREFAYDIERLGRVGFTPRFAINGVVELLALNDREMLVLERGFAESVDRKQAVNRIQIFHVSLDGATDVSTLDTLRGASVKPVTKRRILDVNTLRGLEPRLAGLDNFEGMAWGPAPPGGGPRPLVLVSDDNQSPRQVTAFLFLKR